MDLTPSTSADAGLERTLQVALVMAAAGATGRLRQVPQSRYPMLVELEYGNRLVEFVRARRELYKPLIAEVPLMIGQLPRVDAARGDDALAARRVLEQIRERMLGTLNEGEMKLVARFYGDRLSVQGSRQLAKQLRAGLGIDIPLLDGARISELVSEFAVQNAALISSIPEDLHQEIARLTANAFQRRMSEETFAAAIEERFGVAEGRARFIARNELGKLAGQVSRARHEDLGIEHYFWRTRRDNRVRPHHRAREGKRFSYDSPPRGGHPGTEIACRCVEQPDLSNVLDAISKARSFPGRFSAPMRGTLSRRRR